MCFELDDAYIHLIKISTIAVHKFYKCLSVGNKCILLLMLVAYCSRNFWHQELAKVYISFSLFYSFHFFFLEEVLKHYSEILLMLLSPFLRKRSTERILISELLILLGMTILPVDLFFLKLLWISDFFLSKCTSSVWEELQWKLNAHLCLRCRRGGNLPISDQLFIVGKNFILLPGLWHQLTCLL